MEERSRQEDQGGKLCPIHALTLVLIFIQNIAKAQKELDRLDAEDADESQGAKDTARKPAQKNQAVNGDAVSATAELEQEKDAEDDVADDLKKASIEDKEDAAVEA
jgi:hypothetical protein